MGKKKGAKTQGRAKQKQKAQKGGTPRTTPRSRGGGVQQMLLDDDWEEDSPIHFRGFAQNNPSQFAPRSVQAKLRHQAISFVSAGVNAPIVRQHKSDNDTEEDVTLEESDDEDDENDDDSLIQTNIIFDADLERSKHGVANLSINANMDTMEVDEETATATTSDVNIIGVDESSDGLPFVVDTIGDASLADPSSAFKHRTAKRATSPTPSNSSEEVVFLGRVAKPTILSDPILQINPSQTQPPSQTLSASDPSSEHPTAAPASTTAGLRSRPSKHDSYKCDGTNWTPAPAVPYWRKGKGKAILRPDLASSIEEKSIHEESSPKQSRAHFAEQSNSDTKDAEKSIKSLLSQDKKAVRGGKVRALEANYQKLDASQGAGSSRRKRSGRKKDNKMIREVLISDDDEMSEAAYNDYMENLAAQLEGEEENVMAALKASRHIAGPSLVVDGTEVGDDELLPEYTRKENATMELADDSEWESDDELNPDFDELSTEASRNASDLEDTDLEDALDYAEREQWEDEEDLRQRRIDRMSDEQLARLFAKQQELGMDADQLLIEDGNYMSLSNDYGDVAAARVGLSDITNATSTRRANRYGMRRRAERKNHFPDASAFADTLDQYGHDGFDIMDFDRPSLRPRKKGRKGQLPPELEMLSDDELKEEMANQWENDRARKSQKKLEREELRASGLLGSAGRKGKADLQAKYPMGMDMGHVHDELREFLQDDDLRERAFPPMAKKDRKALHEISISLNLNSRSQGAGKKRFPVIYKTSRTGEYSDDMFVKIVQASSRGFLSNSRSRKFAKKGGLKGPGGKGQGQGGGRGGGVAAASVRHGEIVGAGAAEISQDSFGHKMMLKMGWTKGMALGKDGDGLLVPVEQRMRVGTAGLG